MMRWAAVLACAGLAGCFGTGGALTIKVPVPVACQEAVPARPAMPTEGLKPGGQLFASTVRMQAEIELREGYETKLRTALEACVKPIHSSASQ